jgi:beta-xylosidase
MPWDQDNFWSSHLDFPVEDWKYVVANDDTRLSYVTWVARWVELEEERNQEGNLNGGI